MSKKSKKKCQKTETALQKCVEKGTYIIDIEDYELSGIIISDYQKSKEYKKMIDDEIEKNREQIILDYRMSEEFENITNQILNEYNRTEEAQKIIIDSANEEFASLTLSLNETHNETLKQMEERADDVVRNLYNTFHSLLNQHNNGSGIFDSLDPQLLYTPPQFSSKESSQDKSLAPAAPSPSFLVSQIDPRIEIFMKAEGQLELLAKLKKEMNKNGMNNNGMYNLGINDRSLYDLPYADPINNPANIMYYDDMDYPFIHNEPNYYPSMYDQFMYNEPNYWLPTYNEPMNNPHIMYIEPMNNAPMYNEPMYDPSMYNEPMNNPAMYNEPMNNPAIYNEPMYNAPMNNPAMYNAPMYNAPMNNPAMYNAPMNNPAMHNAPMNNAHMYNAPMNNPAMYNEPIRNPQTLTNNPKTSYNDGVDSNTDSLLRLMDNDNFMRNLGFLNGFRLDKKTGSQHEKSVKDDQSYEIESGDKSNRDNDVNKLILANETILLNNVSDNRYIIKGSENGDNKKEEMQDKDETVNLEEPEIKQSFNNFRAVFNLLANQEEEKKIDVFMKEETLTTSWPYTTYSKPTAN